MRLKRGLTEVYTGDGKGKTTAALGLSLRAVGHGLHVCFVQFAKGDWDKGERKAAESLSPDFELHSFAAPRWGDPSKAPPGTPWWLLPPSDEDRSQAQAGLTFALRALTEGRYDMVVLDEVFAALTHHLVTLEQVLELMRARPEQVELVMTGRRVPEEVVEAADLVTEMRAVKHPFTRGVAARRGIEY
jgi:cob(I)alamin adenosyltransferase